MMQFEAKTYATGAEIYEAARSLRYLHAPALRRPVPKAAALPLPPPVFVPPRVVGLMPYWMACDIEFDVHVHTWLAWQALHHRNCTRYIKSRAAELGFSFRAIRGKDRHRPVVAARQLLMWEVRTIFNKTLPEVGRLFGGRDHTTALHAVRKIERLKAEGKM